MQNKRLLSLTICDYQKRAVCPLYDSNANISGQATDVCITTERNGWKELSFTIPSTYQTTEGLIEDNFRLEYLKADYLIRAIDDTETDWYVISEPRINHEAFSKKVTVTAGHISQLLKFKNYGLEFSDEEGNNIGTAQELLTTILDGTGWSVGYVYPFAEKNGSTKYRSMKASTRTGAFKLISTLCDLFEAKPVYHGDARTVDLLPINPFSQPDIGTLPDLSLSDGVVELCYGKNISNVQRTLNTENIVTKLYAYGSYGDKTSGYCGIDECTHVEYRYKISSQCAAGTYWFSYTDETSVRCVRHFTTSTAINAGDICIFSTMDPCSMLYLWNETQQVMYPVFSGTDGKSLPSIVEKNDDVKNWFQFIMDFDYYREVGLLTDDLLQIVADYQRKAPQMFERISQASTQLSDARTTLSETIGYVDFCRIDVKRDELLLDDTYVTLVLNKETYSDGVMYRTDYDAIKKNQFKWRAADSLDKNGDPINTAASVVYIIHNTSPITWDKGYIKKIYNEDEPDAVTIWIPRKDLTINPKTDKFYLFSFNSVNGYLGTLESADESACKALEEAVKLVTVNHPVQFVNSKNTNVASPELHGYGWRWVYYDDKSPSQLYFCYEEEGDTAWHKVLFQDTRPNVSTGRYWYNWRSAVLYRNVDNSWKALDTASEKRVAALFATVYMYGKTRDKYYQGLSMNYRFSVPRNSTLPAGNYFIENEYNSYWVVTTSEDLAYGDYLYYNYKNGWVTQIKNGVETQLSSKAYRFDNVSYHVDNLLAGKEVIAGALDKNGAIMETENKCKTQGWYSVVPKTKYTVSGTKISATVHYYDDKKRWLSAETFSTGFTVPSDCGFVCIVFDMTKAAFDAVTDYVISAENKENMIIIKDLNYVRLSPIEKNGDNIGILALMKKFSQLSDTTYLTYYQQLKTLQDQLTSLEKNMNASIGDLYREGWWQDSSYVDGDEQKLYDDALENLKEISKPEAKYSIKYLDLYETNINNKDFGAAEETASMFWPDISMASAVHLVDPEISVNAWAYFDKIKKCYDNPKDTTVSINTNLSTISQHSFQDVMTNIANVASRMKGNESYYDSTLKTSANKGEISDVNADLIHAGKKINTVMESVEHIGDTLINHETSITMTQDEISFEAQRYTEENNRLASQLKITAEAIQSEVARATKEEEKIASRITQSADQISFTIETIKTEVGQQTQEAKDAASNAQQAANAAQNRAEDAISAANKANKNSSDAQQAANNAHDVASGAQTAASNAQQKADDAISSASDAQQKADDAISSAGKAQQTASDAQTTAGNAQQKANDAISSAGKAQETANSAQNVAGKAQETANNAQTAAGKAQETASGAQTAAGNAQQTANNAQTAADNAQQKADNAQTAADNAQQKADDAQTAAGNAQEAADNAQEAANKADKKVEDITNGTTPVKRVVNTSLTLDTNGIDMTGGKITMGAATSIEMKTFDNVDSSALSITPDGISMNSGNIRIKSSSKASSENAVSIGQDGISMKAGTAFTAESGGTVKINAENGEDSYITLGDMFSATKTGGVRAAVASFDEARIKGNSVLTTEVLDKRIVVSKTQPEGHGILWFSPSATTQVKYGYQTGPDRNQSLLFSGGTNYQSKQTVSALTADTLGEGKLSYEIEFTLYMIDGGTKSESNLTMDITLSKGDKSVVFDTIQVPYMSIWKEVTIKATKTGDSLPNLCADDNPITITFSLGKYNSFHIYIQANTWINLTCTNSDASSEKMPCSIFYLP